MTAFPGEIPELSGLLSQLQQQMTAVHGQLGAEEVVGSAGGGAVRIRVSGEWSFSAVHIDPAVVAAGDVQVVEDLVLAALRDAVTKLAGARQVVLGSAIGEVMGALFDEDGGDEGDDGDGEGDGPDAAGLERAGGDEQARGDEPGGPTPGSRT